MNLPSLQFWRYKCMSKITITPPRFLVPRYTVVWLYGQSCVNHPTVISILYIVHMQNNNLGWRFYKYRRQTHKCWGETCYAIISLVAHFCLKQSFEYRAHFHIALQKHKKTGIQPMFQCKPGFTKVCTVIIFRCLFVVHYQYLP